MEILIKQIDFILELDKLKAVYRKAMIKEDNNRNENSAEHSWHVSLLALVLHEYADDKINILKVLKMLLIHDIVEIDAGDTFAFSTDESLRNSQEEREKLALERIFGLLPEEQAEEFKKIWIEFENGETKESLFAKSMDRIIPLIQNMRNEGGSWVGHNISREKLLEHNQYMKEVSKTLSEYLNSQIDIAVNRGWING